jgi:hypothetical protein
MRIDFSSEQAVQLVMREGYIVAQPLRVLRTTRCITVLVKMDGPDRPVRITKHTDGTYRATLSECAHSNDPQIAKKAWRAKRLRQKAKLPGKSVPDTGLR